MVLRPGDSLWSVAEAALTAALGRPPDTGRLGAYWWRLVALNRDRLPLPGHPDYVRPGWVALLPPTAAEDG